MFPELFSVAGKTALITGGTRGIGYMIAEGYLRAGVRVYISSRKPDACELAQQELSQFGEVHAIPADVRDAAWVDNGSGWIGVRPITSPTQDMVLGIYHLTTQQDGAAGEGRT